MCLFMACCHFIRLASQSTFLCEKTLLSAKVSVRVILPIKVYPNNNLHTYKCDFYLGGDLVLRSFKNILCVLVAFFLVTIGIMCLWTRIRDENFSEKQVMLAAAALTMPNGSVDGASVKNKVHNSQKQTENNNKALPVIKTKASAVFSENPSIYADEAHYPVLETTYSNGEFGFNNFFVKNTTGYEFDIGRYLNRSLGFDFEKSNKVQVLIVHTHTTESYLTYDAGFYHESFHSRSEDPEKNMVRVGEALRQGLEAQGIGVVHATEVHDSPQYDGAYYRSYDTIEKYLKMYPDIKVVLDLHRDSIGYGSEGGKVKPTFTANGKKAAQIMIMAGYDPDGYYDFPFWQDNLTFALKIQDTAENMYPGMTRPLYFGNFAYNMNVNNGSLLIEVGTDANTLEEAVYTGELLSNVLSKVLQSG